MDAHAVPAASRWLDRLNPQQRDAATFGQPERGHWHAGPLLIIAGAGTGKTSTLAHRVAHLVLEGVDPARILLLTFSRRAAVEMTRRAERLIAQVMAERRGPTHAVDAGVRLPWAGTFHAIGARLLRLHARELGLDPGFGILDRGDAADLLDVLRHEQGLSAKTVRFPRKDTCLAIYSQRVNTGWSLDKVLRAGFPWCEAWQASLVALFRAYVDRKQANAVLDYDDLLLWWEAAMSDPGLAREVGRRFDHVLVDEYQDTNALQARILLAMKPDGQGLTVVGDDAQSIYAFRAADVGNILEFPQRFTPPATQITLERNYRSVQPVLDAANALIAQAARQHPKTLRSQRGEGARPCLVTVTDERAQADWVIGEILGHREKGVPLKKQAVLFRSAHHSDLLEVELTRRNIPYVKHGGLRFLEAAHVKDLLSVLRWADNPRNEVAGFRALQLMPGMGPANAQRCMTAVNGGGHDRGRMPTPAPLQRHFAALANFAPPAAARCGWPDFIELMCGLADPEARWTGQVDRVLAWYRPLLAERYDDAAVRTADLDMLTTVASQFGSRERFLTELALDPPSASGDLAGEPLRDEDYLILSTVHSAKGQEWDCVYVLNVTDGNFPNEYSTGSAESIEEERRLLYVAITRARNALSLIEPLRHHVTQQHRYGDAHVHAARSRFLTPQVLDCLDRAAAGEAAHLPDTRDTADTPQAARVDVQSRIRGMW